MTTKKCIRRALFFSLMMIMTFLMIGCGGGGGGGGSDSSNFSDISGVWNIVEKEISTTCNSSDPETQYST